MDESPIDNEKKDRPIHKIFTVILIAIVIIAAIFFINLNFFSGANKVLTTTYSIILPRDAYDLIKNQSEGLTIVDIRTCKCNYENNHLHRAIWDINPSSFYNTSDDLIIYDIDGTRSPDFCKKLVNNVYGKIMYLQGGMDNWLALGYPVIT